MAFDCVWQPPTTDLVLSKDDVHIWRASLEQPLTVIQQLEQTLSQDECLRAERFHFAQNRNFFIVGRGLLRLIIGKYLGLAPSQLEFSYGNRGKPFLADVQNNRQLRFNLSHSQALVLYAISCDRQIGIDLEHIRQISEAAQIAKSFFSAREYAQICALPPSQQQTAFFYGWTRKEAYIKAIGEGLAYPLNQIEVSLLLEEPARLLSIGGNSQAAAGWTLQNLIPAPDYVAALAVEGSDFCLKCWQWCG